MRSGSDLTEGNFETGLYDEEHYGDLEAVADWALQEHSRLKDSDLALFSDSPSRRTYNVMDLTRNYLEREYNHSKIALGAGSSLDAEDAKQIVEKELSEKTDADQETWDKLDRVRYNLKRLQELE